MSRWCDLLARFVWLNITRSKPNLSSSWTLSIATRHTHNITKLFVVVFMLILRNDLTALVNRVTSIVKLVWAPISTSEAIKPMLTWSK